MCVQAQVRVRVQVSCDEICNNYRTENMMRKNQSTVSWSKGEFELEKEKVKVELAFFIPFIERMCHALKSCTFLYIACIII